MPSVTPNFRARRLRIHGANPLTRCVNRPVCEPEGGDTLEASDDILMGRCRAGERQAMDALVSRYHRRVYNFAWRMLHQREAAEDVAQETFLRAYRNACRYRAGGRFPNWLFAIAANLCRTELRRKTRHPERSWDEIGEMEAPDSVEGSALRHIESVALRDALEHLSADHRMTLILFYFEGLSQQDIAQVCDCSVGTVKSRLHYALARLRTVFPQSAPGLPAPARVPG